MKIDASGLGYRALNEQIKKTDDATVINVCGERFIASGQSKKTVKLYGTPGNALGAYLDGASVEVFGNGQDAVGDTMNDGKILIRGSVGDALGYAMRGGKIYIGGDAGYRCGVHIKEYKDKKPVIVIGGKAGSFLGEYMAGGVVIILNLNGSAYPVADFTGVGMHGGKIFVRTEEINAVLPPQVKRAVASKSDLDEIEPYLREYASDFGLDAENILKSGFMLLTPDSSNPYKRLYTVN